MVRPIFPPCRAPGSSFYGLLGTLPVFPGAGGAGGPLHPEQKLQGIFVQGSFRGNMGIMGLAYVQNAHGPRG